MNVSGFIYMEAKAHRRFVTAEERKCLASVHVTDRGRFRSLNMLRLTLVFKFSHSWSLIEGI
jgi:hypothetical protein